jgi:hypothetical protein
MGRWSRIVSRLNFEWRHQCLFQVIPGIRLEEIMNIYRPYSLVDIRTEYTSSAWRYILLGIQYRLHGAELYENLTVVRLLKKFPRHYGVWNIITTFRRIPSHNLTHNFFATNSTTIAPPTPKSLPGRQISRPHFCTYTLILHASLVPRLSLHLWFLLLPSRIKPFGLCPFRIN